MRSSQHNNKRSRGRSRSRHSGSGGGGNPINRVYESNGPDVKVRGTAQTVADKYLQLGRDAQASGDNVMAENFYQHAEHYLRILAAAQAYNQQFQQQQQQYRRPPGDEMFDEDESEEGGDIDSGDSQQPFSERPQYGQDSQPQQPSVADAAEQPATESLDSQPPPQQPRPPRDYGRDRGRYRGWDNRREGEDRNRQPMSQQRHEQPAPVSQNEPAETAQPASAGEKWDGPQPSFLKRATNGSGSSRSRSERKPRREADSTENPEAASGEEAPAK